MENKVDSINPEIMKPVAENNRVRVLKVVFQPGQKAPLHHHPDHVIYVVNGGKMKLTVNGKADILDLKTGDSFLLNEQWHEAENVGNNVVDMIVVELK